jgi:hypothetical protein
MEPALTRRILLEKVISSLSVEYSSPPLLNTSNGEYLDFYDSTYVTDAPW